MDTTDSRKGHSNIELILVMLLLVLFSISTLTLVASGSDAYISSVNKTDVTSNLRIAQSYIYTKVRQNMESGTISVADHEGIEGRSLVISGSYEGTRYDTIIFVSDGIMRETVLLEGVEFDPSASFEIVSLDSLDFEEIEGKGISFKTALTDEGNSKELKGFISLITD